MKSIFVDCTLGISGDMLASAFFDLGVPISVFLDNLVSLKIDNYFNINFHKVCYFFTYNNLLIIFLKFCKTNSLFHLKKLSFHLCGWKVNII